MILFLMSTSVLADSDSANQSGISLKGTGHGRHAGVKTGAKKEKNNSKVISGTCETLASPSNPIAGACVNIVLMLKDAEGKVAGKSRTATDGQFEFQADPDKLYTIESGSRYFEVVEAKSTTTTGRRIIVHLKQK